VPNGSASEQIQQIDGKLMQLLGLWDGFCRYRAAFRQRFRAETVVAPDTIQANGQHGWNTPDAGNPLKLCRNQRIIDGMGPQHDAVLYASMIAVDKAPPQLSARQAVFKVAYNWGVGWISVSP
jgi:hypothetical protein